MSEARHIYDAECLGLFVVAVEHHQGAEYA